MLVIICLNHVITLWICKCLTLIIDAPWNPGVGLHSANLHTIETQIKETSQQKLQSVSDPGQCHCLCISRPQFNQQHRESMAERCCVSGLNQQPGVRTCSTLGRDTLPILWLQALPKARVGDNEAKSSSRVEQFLMKARMPYSNSPKRLNTWNDKVLKERIRGLCIGFFSFCKCFVSCCSLLKELEYRVLSCSIGLFWSSVSILCSFLKGLASCWIGIVDAAWIALAAVLFWSDSVLRLLACVLVLGYRENQGCQRPTAMKRKGRTTASCFRFWIND